MPDRVISVPQATQIATRIKNKFDNVNGRLHDVKETLGLPTYKWTLGKNVDNEGHNVTNNYIALTDLVPCVGGDRIIRTGVANDGIYTLIYYVNEYTDGVWNKRTILNPSETIVLDTDTNGVRIGFGRTSSSGVPITQEAIDTYFSADFYRDLLPIGEYEVNNGRLPLQVRLSISGTATPGTFEKIVTAFSKGAVVYGYTSTSADVLYTLTSVDLPSTPLDYDVGTLTFTNVSAGVGRLNQIHLTFFGEDETWSYSSYDVADKMTSQEATNLLSIAKGGS